MTKRTDIYGNRIMNQTPNNSKRGAMLMLQSWIDQGDKRDDFTLFAREVMLEYGITKKKLIDMLEDYYPNITILNERITTTVEPQPTPSTDDELITFKVEPIPDDLTPEDGVVVDLPVPKPPAELHYLNQGPSTPEEPDQDVKP